MTQTHGRWSFGAQLGETSIADSLWFPVSIHNGLKCVRNHFTRENLDLSRMVIGRMKHTIKLVKLVYI